MKRLCYIFIAVAAMLLPVSCDIETSGNGDLDGFWHLVSIDTLATSGRADLSQELLFWSFQHNLMTLRNSNYVSLKIVSRFQRAGNDIKVYNPCIDKREEGDIVLKDPEYLIPYGINSIDETFSIEVLNKKQLRLKSQTLRLWFVKM